MRARDLGRRVAEAIFNDFGSLDMTGDIPHLERIPENWKPGEASPWRSIESAPKDGTEVDLWVVWPDSGGTRFTDCHFQPGQDDWWLGQFWLSQYANNPQPTHWMPLPPGPKVKP